MCNGPKSAWNALYRRVSSTVKYTGSLCFEALTGLCDAFAERFDGEDAWLGNGKAAYGSGADEYEARYRRSAIHISI